MGTFSIAESLTLRPRHVLIPIGFDSHTESRNGLRCNTLAGICDAPESTCIQSIKTCYYERRT